MKKIVFIVLTVLAFVSCKNDNKSEQKEEITISDDSERTAKQSDGLILLKGDFVYYGGAAVLQTHADIYGVLDTDKMKELNNLSEKYKTEPTDMVQVEIRGKISKEKDDKILWENKVEVVEILNVSALADEENNVVKIGQE